MRTFIVIVWTVAMLLLGHSRVVTAQEVVLTSGQLEYQSYCASCHGRDGKGKGPMADLLRAVPAIVRIQGPDSSSGPTTSERRPVR
jgi:mono/diheme cytochrome c family protein